MKQLIGVSDGDGRETLTEPGHISKHHITRRICLSCAFQEDQQQTRNEYQQEEHRCLPDACTLNWLCKTMTQLITILTPIHNQALVLMTKLTKIPPEALALSEIYNLSMMEPNTNRLNHRFTLSDPKY